MKATVYAHDLVTEFERRLADYRPGARGAQRKLLEQLALALVKHADERFLLDHPAQLLLPEIETVLAFIEKRVEGEVLVRVAPASEPDGTSAPAILASTCMTDQPFIVDTVRLAFQRLGLDVLHQLNAIVPVARTKAGRLVEIGGTAEAGQTLESITVFELGPIAQEERREKLRSELTDCLIQARAVVLDFQRMVHEVRDVIQQYEQLDSLRPHDRDTIREALAFLRWLAEDNFVFMGATRVGRSGDQEVESRLGTTRFKRDPFAQSYPEVRAFLKPAGGERYVSIHKTVEDAVLHRPGKIDEVLVRRFDAAGQPAGCLALHGLFTYRAIHARGGSVPILRRKLDELVAAEEVVRGSYNYKSLVNSFEALPAEYLFTAGIEDIARLVRGAIAAERSRRLEVQLSLNPDMRQAYLFVVLPNENFNDALRIRIQRFLEERLQANYCDHRVFISNYGVAVLHFYVTSSAAFPALDHAALESTLAEMASSWQDRFREALGHSLARDVALALYRTYQSAFSPRYQVSTPPEQAVRDCLLLEKVRRHKGLEFELYTDAEDKQQGTVKLRIYESRNLYLTDVLPILDDFGLQVINSFVNHVELPGGDVLYMDTFRFANQDGRALDLQTQRGDFLGALAAVFDGVVPSDRLNRVLLPARLCWKQVDLLRSYQGYSKQLGSMFTPGIIWSTLVRYAPIARNLAEWFEARFGPQTHGAIPSRPDPAREPRCQELRERVYEQIDGVESFNDDRILRTFANLIDATLRTNYFRTDLVEHYISHKLDCAKVAAMPEPRPWREIYVHSAKVEGVHLRGGRIARGGLRWSDRPDDYRTEILGLMTTQMVKNVVIVPVGAKGGFVLKRPPVDVAQRRAHADEMYQIFVRGLLDITDNIAGGQTVPPPEVVCYDDFDPYLVVAADKGTAHLSDTANAISAERQFWLGDAFASGGSNGYDHKAMGITARGAWVCIRHLFRELGIDWGKPFSVVGIGDLGGDVFGNGMIEHDTIKLVAAFNHQHIFLDPDPDPVAAPAERRRLFQAKYGGWDAYDASTISKGGGVFERASKSIPLSPQVRKLLSTDRPSMSSAELIHALLQLPADLLYNGGIGTYVKATAQDDLAARDPANDALRIDASQLRARVVGEGGNLGLTQAARVEYARAGGRLNTDFIDNAGGVNTSDHEVNLKVLFQPLVSSGQLTPAARNKLLREMQEQVAQDVLAANASQALMLSLDERRSREDLEPFERLMEDVCRRFGVKRGDIGLPGSKEVEQRIRDREGLTRPELAILGSYVKMMIYDDLVGDASIDPAALRTYLHAYFLARLRSRFAASIDQHRLAREIAITLLTNRIIDHTGATFFSDLAAEAAVTPRQCVEAYTLLAQAADAWGMKEQILALATQAPAAVQYEALLTVESALRQGALHLLERWTPQRVRETLREPSSYARKLKALGATFADSLDEVSAQAAREQAAAFERSAVPSSLALRLAAVRFLPYGLTAIDLADAMDRPARRVAQDYFALGRACGILGTVERLDRRKASQAYEAMAQRSLRRELLDLLGDLVLKLANADGQGAEKLAALGRGAQAFQDLERIPEGELGPASLVVGIKRIRSVLRSPN